MVEDADENRIALAVYLLEFDAHELEVFEHLGIDEETAAVEGTEQTAVFLPLPQAPAGRYRPPEAAACLRKALACCGNIPAIPCPENR